MLAAMRAILMILALGGLAAPALPGESLAVGGTGYSITVPEGWGELPAAELGAATEGFHTVLFAGPAGDGPRVLVLEAGAGATGQAMAEQAGTVAGRVAKAAGSRLVLVGSERVTVAGAGAQCRRYEEGEGAAVRQWRVLVFVKGPARLILMGRSAPADAALVKGCLMSLSRTGPVPEPAESEEPPDNPTGEAPGGDPEKTPPGRAPPESEGSWIDLRGTSLRLRAPAGWTGGPHAPTKGTRIYSPKRQCFIDIVVLKPGPRESLDRSVDRIVDEFEAQLVRQAAGWGRVQSRRERVDGSMARYRCYAGEPGGVACRFHLMVLRSGETVIVMKAIHPSHARAVFEEPVLGCFRSLRRK